MSQVQDIPHRYWLSECIDWIRTNGFQKIAIQLKQEHLKDAVDIADFLKLNCYPADSSAAPKKLDIYVSQANTCCVDLLVTQHVSNIEAIVHIGRVCLSAPIIKNGYPSLPILFIYEKQSSKSPQFSEHVRLIMDMIQSLSKSEKNCHLCLLYDSNLIEYANAIEDQLLDHGLNQQTVNVASLFCPKYNWTTLSSCERRFRRDKDGHIFGPYVLQDPIQDYTCVLYIGDRLPITLALECPPNLTKVTFNHQELKVDKPSTSKLLNKRIALVSRLKEEQELKFGVIITNPLPELTTTIERLRTYSKRRNHTLYFISMIQTVDECKIGNFDLCDAFVVVNSCTCSTIVESLVFNRPILTELEFKLACDWSAEYGRVVWPSSSSLLSDDDIINKRKASDVSLALIQTRNALLERCSQARANKWSGLDYESPGGTDGETLNIEEGLKGIASSYVSEPLKGIDQDKKCCGVEVVANEEDKIEAENAFGGSTTSTSNLVGEAAKLLMRINDYDGGNGES